MPGSGAPRPVALLAAPSPSTQPGRPLLGALHSQLQSDVDTVAPHFHTQPEPTRRP